MSVEKTLAERGSRYGDFTDHARLCQDIKFVMTSFTVGNLKPWKGLPDIHKQALEVIADKIARILSGDPNYADNWHDIQGYAKLVEDRLPNPVSDPKPEPDTSCPGCGVKEGEVHVTYCPEAIKPKHETGFCGHGNKDWTECNKCVVGKRIVKKGTMYCIHGSHLTYQCKECENETELS